jgi:hypothetical protein
MVQGVVVRDQGAAMVRPAGHSSGVVVRDQGTAWVRLVAAMVLPAGRS